MIELPEQIILEYQGNSERRLPETRILCDRFNKLGVALGWASPEQFQQWFRGYRPDDTGPSFDVHFPGIAITARALSEQQYLWIAALNYGNVPNINLLPETLDMYVEIPRVRVTLIP